MDWVVALGVISLGLLIGILVGWYVNEIKVYTQRVVTSSISVFAGGGIIAVFQYLGLTSNAREYWLYPFGLLVGLLVAPPLDCWFQQLYKKPKATKRSAQRTKKRQLIRS